MSASSFITAFEMKHRFHLYMYAAGAAAFVSLLSCAALNVLVDPYGAFFVTGHAWDSHREWHVGRRVKAEVVRSRRFDVLLVGASRVHIGFDPRHQALGGGAVFNAGLAGGTAFEFSRMVDLAIYMKSKEA